MKVQEVSELATVRSRALAGNPERPIPFHLPSVPDVEGFLADARTIIESGRLSEGPYVRELERRLSSWVGNRDVVAVSNCSDGLIASLSIAAPRGAEVIIPGFTYLATWQALTWAGMTPVVADVDDRGLLRPEAVADALTSRTAAVVAVHVAGTMAPMAALRAVTERAGIALVADGAHAVGAHDGTFPAGSIGDFEVFSIGATKQVAAGEGGYVAVGNPQQVPALRQWALQGHEPGSMDVIGPGMNLRLAELTAALALRQLDGLDAQLARRQLIHERYVSGLGSLPMRLSGPRATERSAHKDQLVWVDDPRDREPLRDALASARIGTKPYYDRAVPDLTAFVGRVASVDQSRALASRSFAIPIHARLVDDDVDRIVDVFQSFYAAR